MRSSVDAVGFLVAVAIVKTVMIGVASAIVDVQGRRVLLLCSSAGIVASLGLLDVRACFAALCLLPLHV